MKSRGIEILIHYCGFIENIFRSTCLITEMLQGNTLRFNAAFLDRTRTLSAIAAMRQSHFFVRLVAAERLADRAAWAAPAAAKASKFSGIPG